MHPNLLDQLHVFRTVKEEGSFSAAAEKLNKTVSTISYSISTLEKQLQMVLFDRNHYRPTLTEFGQDIYEEADFLLRRVDRFQARVGLHREQLKSNLVLSVDTVFPRVVLVRALAQFSEVFPMMNVSVLRRDYEVVVNDMRDGFADIGLLRVDARLDLNGLDAMQIGSSQNLLVAAADHVLATRDTPFELAELEEHRQLILSRSPDKSKELQYRTHRTDAWTLPDEEMLRELIKSGVGWAYVARHVVWKDIEEGLITELKCSSIRENTILRFGMIWPVGKPNLCLHQMLSRLLRQNFPAAFPDNFHTDFGQWVESDRP